MRVIPTSPAIVITEFQTFRNPRVSTEVLPRVAGFYLGIEREDHDLCNGVRKILNSNYSSAMCMGPLYPYSESGVLYLKKSIKEELRRHLYLEKEAGHEVITARLKQVLYDGISKDEDVCAAICDKTGSIEDLQEPGWRQSFFWAG